MPMPNSQPNLPAEGPYNDVERVFIDEQPSIWPKNQNSNLGTVRRVITQPLQDAVDQALDLWNQLFVFTAFGYLGLWEADMGLPKATVGRSDAQRRILIGFRLQKGPFTRTRRRNLVEAFIKATFGTPISFGPGGVPFDGTGIPLYGEAQSLAGTYAIRENWPLKNLIGSGNANFESGVGGWIEAAYGGAAGVLTVDNADKKFGAQSAKQVVTVGGDVGIEIDNIPATPGKTYTLSAYVKGPVGASAYLRRGNSTERAVGPYIIMDGSWQRVPLTFIQEVGEVTNWIRVNTDAVGTWRIDGIQLEEGDTATDWSDPDGPDFYYEVRVLDSLSIDVNGLQRELAHVTPSGISFDVTLTPTP